jgi:hypothetical protein
MEAAEVQQASSQEDLQEAPQVEDPSQETPQEEDRMHLDE